MSTNLREIIQDSDLILVGVGTEFEAKKYCVGEKEQHAIRKLLELLNGKNYFLITTCTNDILEGVGFKGDRIVSPCGTMKKKQCENCENSIVDLTEEDCRLLECAIEKGEVPSLGKCPVCGKSMVLNNVYADNYDENGYLPNWSIYKKWLQGTINRKLCIMELGVDLSFPSVIRWPFEKIAFYNQKAHFIRVNERLYHMSEELKDKGVSIAENSIDWLLKEDI